MSNLRPFFSIFGLHIPYYGLMMVTGFALAAVTAILFRGKKYNIKRDDLLYAAIFAMIGGIVGAKLFSVFQNLPLVFRGKIHFLDLLNSGFVFYGGLIGGILGLFAYVKCFNLSLIKFFDIFSVSVPLGHAFGRIGCFFGGCCYGIEYDGPISFMYPDFYSSSEWKYGTPTGVSLLPVQLLEAGSLLVLYAVLSTLFHRTKKPGISLATYLCSYAVIRFTLEFFRGDLVRGIAAGVSTSQWISMLVILLGVAIIAYIVMEDKRQKNSPLHGQEIALNGAHSEIISAAEQAVESALNK